jgi:hypothetical protein
MNVTEQRDANARCATAPGAAAIATRDAPRTTGALALAACVPFFPAAGAAAH